MSKQNVKIQLSQTDSFHEECADVAQTFRAEKHQEDVHKIQSLEARIEELQQMNQCLDAKLLEMQKQASISQFVAAMAHEINTPIGVALMAISLLKENTEKTEKKYHSTANFSRKEFQEYISGTLQSLDILLKNINRAGQLIGSFKNLSADQHSDIARDIELKPYLEEILVMLSPVLKRSPHKIAYQVEPGWVICSLPGALVQVLTNLIMNSLIHGFEGINEGQINITISRDKNRGWAVLDYKDDGIGMTEEVKKRLFEPFFTTKKGCGGTGLGMPIIERIVKEQLKGELSFESEPGKGVCFRIAFPERLENAYPT